MKAQEVGKYVSYAMVMLVNFLYVIFLSPGIGEGILVINFIVNLTMSIILGVLFMFVNGVFERSKRMEPANGEIICLYSLCYHYFEYWASRCLGELPGMAI